MATFVLTDARIAINGTDLSDHGNQVSISYEAETQDDTAFGDDTRSNAGGLKNWSASVTFLQDFASGEVDATLFPLVGTAVTVSFRGTSGAKSTTNPDYGDGTTTGLIQSYSPFGNSVGDMATASLEIVPGGSSPDLVRATS